MLFVAEIANIMVHSVHKLIIKVDQQSTYFFLLSCPTFPLSENWDELVDYRKLSTIN